MRVQWLEVENFRSFKDRVRWGPLGRLEVVHGPNNAGKSNLILALRLAMRLLIDDGWGDSSRGEEDDDGIVVPWEDSAVPGPYAHRDAQLEPTRLSIELVDPTIEASFILTPRPEVRASSVVATRWTVNGELFRPPQRASGGKVLLGSASMNWLSRALKIPPEPVRVLDDRHTPPDDETSWDAWFWHRLERDTDGVLRRRRVAIETALMEFPAFLGPGRLAPLKAFRRATKRDDDIIELAWEREDGVPIPFREQGAGVRSIKDILLAIAGSESPVVVLEEPEAHLSEASQVQLRSLLDRLSSSTGQQLLITSHVWSFDGPTCWRLRREDEGTLLERGPVASGEPDESRDARLLRRYAEAGRPTPSWVSQSGIVQLPNSVRAHLELPDILTFALLEDDTILAVPEQVMRSWSEE